MTRDSTPDDDFRKRLSRTFESLPPTNDFDLADVDAYVDGTLDPSRRAAFALRLLRDRDLAETARLALAARDAALAAPPRSIISRWWIWVALAFSAGILLFAVWQQIDDPSRDNRPSALFDAAALRAELSRWSTPEATLSAGGRPLLPQGFVRTDVSALDFVWRPDGAQECYLVLRPVPTLPPIPGIAGRGDRDYQRFEPPLFGDASVERTRRGTGRLLVIWDIGRGPQNPTEEAAVESLTGWPTPEIGAASRSRIAAIPKGSTAKDWEKRRVQWGFVPIGKAPTESDLSRTFEFRSDLGAKPSTGSLALRPLIETERFGEATDLLAETPSRREALYFSAVLMHLLGDRAAATKAENLLAEMGSEDRH